MTVTCILYGRCPFSICSGCSVKNLNMNKRETHQQVVNRRAAKLLIKIERRYAVRSNESAPVRNLSAGDDDKRLVSAGKPSDGTD